MRLSEWKENMFSFAEREHSRSYHAAKIQNIFKMVVSLQPFLIQFTRFLSENHKKHLKNDLLSERNGVSNTIRRCKYELPSKEKEVDWINFCIGK